MSEAINGDLIRTLIYTVQTTNDAVKELSSDVKDLVLASEKNNIASEQQKEWNAKQEKFNEAQNAKWEKWQPTLLNAKQNQENRNKIMIGVVSFLLLGVLGFFFSFK